MDIRLAKIEDLVPIQSFISENWKKDHIFVNDEKFFIFEMTANRKPSFICAWREKQLVGLLGFVKNREILHDSDLFLVMFRVLKTQSETNIGQKMIEFARSLTTRGIHTTGANPKTLPYYRFLGFTVGWMDHTYWLNTSLESSINFIANARVKKQSRDRDAFNFSSHGLSQIPFDETMSKIANIRIPDIHPTARSYLSFEKRYLLHPLYKYKFFESNRVEGVCVVREVNILGATCWRIVDWFGLPDDFAEVISGLISAASKRGICLIDCYTSGIDASKLITNGLSAITSDVIIPNYLEPLVLRNIKLSCVSSYEKMPFFMRGDGDQDRPSKSH